MSLHSISCDVERRVVQPCGFVASAARATRSRDVAFTSHNPYSACALLCPFTVCSAGSSLPITVVLAMGGAKLLGDGLSMGLGDTLSEGAELAFAAGERAREAWELRNHPVGEIAEMIRLYEDRGFSKKEAETVMAALTDKARLNEPESTVIASGDKRAAAYRAYFLEHMCLLELGIPPEDATFRAWKAGLITLAAFLACGALPLGLFAIFWAAEYRNASGQMGMTSVLILLQLFSLGVIHARMLGQGWLKHGCMMAVNGALAAAAAYLVGLGLHAALSLKKEDPGACGAR